MQRHPSRRQSSCDHSFASSGFGRHLLLRLLNKAEFRMKSFESPSFTIGLRPELVVDIVVVFLRFEPLVGASSDTVTNRIIFVLCDDRWPLFR